MADLLSIDSNRVVVSGRAEQIALLLACGVDEGAWVAKKCSTEGEHLNRQSVGVRMRAASARPVIATVDYRIQVAGALNEYLRFRKRARSGASFIDRQALEGFDTRFTKPPDRFLIDLTPLFECTILKED